MNNDNNAWILCTQISKLKIIRKRSEEAGFKKSDKFFVFISKSIEIIYARNWLTIKTSAVC